MSQVPANTDLSAIQQAFRDVYTAMGKLLQDLHGQVLRNAGDARLGTDLATLGQVKEEISTAIKKLNNQQNNAPANGYNQIQDEGINLAKRSTLNFIGGGVVAADDPSGRTNVTVQTASASLEGTVTTGAQTIAGAKTLTGTTKFQQAGDSEIQLISTSNDATAFAGMGFYENTSTQQGYLRWHHALGGFAFYTNGQPLYLGYVAACPVIGTDRISAGNYFRINDAVPTAGHVLRGNGTTGFVDATLAAADLSNGTTGTGKVVLDTGPTVSSGTSTTQFTVQGAGTPDLIIMVGATPSGEFFHDGSNGTIRSDVGNLAIDAATGKLVRALKPLTVAGATPTSAAGEIGFGNTQGIGNGAATNMQAPLKATGTGPTTAVTVVNWLEIDIAGTKYWVPLMQ